LGDVVAFEFYICHFEKTLALILFTNPAALISKSALVLVFVAAVLALIFAVFPIPLFWFVQSIRAKLIFPFQFSIFHRPTLSFAARATVQLHVFATLPFPTPISNSQPFTILSRSPTA
jgi:hypothetical protein